MKATNIIPFFKNGQHIAKGSEPATESQVFNNQIYSNLTLEVKGDDLASALPIMVSGCIDTEADASYVDIAGVNLSDSSPIEKIESAGLYSFKVTGISHIKITLTSAEGEDATITGCFSE